MAHEPSEGAFKFFQTCIYPLLCCFHVCRPIWDRSITPNVITIYFIRIHSKLGVDAKILLQELMLKEETFITEVARDNRWISHNVGDVLNFAALRVPIWSRVIRYVARPNLEQLWTTRNLCELFIEWNLTTIFIVFALFFWPKLSQVWVGYEPHIPWHFMRVDPCAIGLPFSEFS